MARKETFIKGIFLDETQNQESLNPDESSSMTAAQLTAATDMWIHGVRHTLRLLYDDQPCATSRAILDAITAVGKKVTIVPSKTRALGGADKLMGNAAAVPDDYQAATAPGKLTEIYKRDPRLGVGGGSDSTIDFTPQDWDDVESTPVSFKAVDEVLLHELVHALRQNLGQEDNATLPPPRADMGLGGITQLDVTSSNGWPPPTSMTQVYGNLEEFAAILITNIYRSENQRIGLVRDHLAPQPLRGDRPDSPERPFRDPKETTRTLGWPLTKPRNFMTLWKSQITRLSIELNAQHVAYKIANVPCAFNPFLELMRK